MSRRYKVEAVFTDSDFGDLPTFKRKFFTRLSANQFWYQREQLRRRTVGAEGWTWVVYDTKTGENITPDL